MLCTLVTKSCVVHGMLQACTNTCVPRWRWVVCELTVIGIWCAVFFIEKVRAYLPLLLLGGMCGNALKVLRFQAL